MVGRFFCAAFLLKRHFLYTYFCVHTHFCTHFFVFAHGSTCARLAITGFEVYNCYAITTFCIYVYNLVNYLFISFIATISLEGGGWVMAVYCYGCMTQFQANLQVCPTCHARIPYQIGDARDCPPGTLLMNRYLLGRALGHGGFGVTYIALDLNSKKKVCIKECNVKDSTYRDQSDPVRLLVKNTSEATEWFTSSTTSLRNECETLKALRHVPEVTHYVDSFACNNTHYLVMEYLEGYDLKQYVNERRSDKNPLSIDEAVTFTIRALNILSQVHRKGLLHCDISPDNIYMLTDGTIRLIDFGSAHPIGAGDAPRFQKEGYTPPETRNFKTEGRYTDIYSAGAVLYFLLTGNKPVRLEDNRPLPPPPENLTTPELTAIFTKAVQPAPEDRYQSAEEMAQALTAFLNDRSPASPSPVPDASRRSRALMIGVVSAILLLLLTVILAVGFSGGGSAPASTPTPVPARTPVAATATPTPSPSPTPTPTATPSPTPTMTPVPAQLRLRPDDRYTLAAGSTVDVPVSFNEAGAFDLQLAYDEAALSIDTSVQGRLRVTALQDGESEVSYFDGQQRCTFRVVAYAHPTLRMLTPESDTLMFSPDAQGGTLFLPKGAQAQILAGGLMTPALLFRSEGDTCAELSITTGEDGQTLTITGTDMGEQTYFLCADDLTLYTLHVTVMPHAVTQTLQQHYSLYEGCFMTLDLSFTDGASLDLAQDVVLQSACLSASMTEGGALQLEGVQPGVADVSINGQMFRVTVMDRPTLRGSALTASRSETSYSLTLTKGEDATLTLAGVQDQLPIAINHADTVPDAEIRGASVLLDTSVPGDHPYAFQWEGQTLFTLTLHVQELGLSTQFAECYDLYTTAQGGIGLCLPLTYLDGRAFDLADTLVVENDCITARIAYDEEGAPWLYIDPLQAGSTSVTLAEQTFRVNVSELSPRLTFSSSQQKVTLEPDDAGHYVLNILPTELGKVTVLDLPDDLTLHLSPMDSDAPNVVFAVDGHRLDIRQLSEGTARFALYASDAQGRVGQLCGLTVNAAVPMALLTRFDARYTLLPGETRTLDLSFEGDQSFTPEMSVESNDVATLTLEDTALTLTALTTGETTMTVDGQTFTVQVLPLPTLSSDRLTRDGDVYSLTLEVGESVTLDVIDGFNNADYNFAWNTPGCVVFNPAWKDHVLTTLTITGEDVGTETIKCIIPTHEDPDEEYIDQWIDLFTLEVTVQEHQQMITGLKDSYLLYHGSSQYWLSFTNNSDPFEYPVISSADESIAAASLDVRSGDSVLLSTVAPGTTTITVGDCSFEVTVLPRVYPVCDRLVATEFSVFSNDPTGYTLDLVVGETVTIGYTTDDPTYHFDCRSITNDDLLNDTAEQMLDVHELDFSVTALQPGTYDFICVAELEHEEAITGFICYLTVNVTEPEAELLTRFDESYTMLLGESCYIPLSTAGNASALSASCETMNVRVEDGRLNLDATAEGQHTVTVQLGENQQSFTVNVLTPRAVWSQGTFILPQDESGHYLLSMFSSSTVTLNLSCTGLIDTILCSRNSEDFAQSDMTFRFGSTFSYTLTTGDALDHASPITVSATLPEKRGETAMYATADTLPLATLLVTVEDVWQLSNERVCTLTEDQDAVIIGLCHALKSLGLLKGDADMHASRAIESTGGLREDIWALMEEVRTTYDGFSPESFYTREDYDRLLVLGAAADEASEASAGAAETVKPAATASASTEEKSRFYIVSAAADANALYLLDEDGYLIQYDRDLTRCQQIWDAHDFTLLSGSGTRVLAERDNSSCLLLGDDDAATQAALDICATDISAAAVTQDALLLLLGSDGIFAVENDKRLNPDGEDMFLEEGQAVYLWPGSESAMGVSINRESTAAENVLMTASGDQTIAILCEADGRQTLYVKSTAKNTALSKKVGTINQSSRLFVKVEAALGSDRAVLNAAAIAVNNDDLAVVQQDGTVYILGANDRYQCGTGSNRERQYFQQVLRGEDQPLDGIAQVALMDGYTLLLDKDGHVWICGSCNGAEDPYARILTSVSGVSRMVRIDETQVLLMNYDGQVMLLRHGQPMNNGTFMNVQR